jgi:hypothetical protein
MKNLQAKVRVAQEKNQARQAQLEPLHQQDEKMIVELETKKGRME